MKSLGEIVKLSVDYVNSKSTSHSRRDVEEIIAFSINKKRLDLYLNFEEPLTENELAAIRKNIARLAKDEPIQYIEGSVDFYGCNIAVTPAVLIPRPETELLVEKIVKEMDGAKKVLWDICTGSGCIGIAIKKVCPFLDVTLSDISQDALLVAKQNAGRNEVQLELIEGNLLKPFLGKKADYIVCNPPYIAEGEYRALDANVRDFEPKQALVSGDTGLECYRSLLADLPKVMNPGGTVWLEIGSTQADAIVAMCNFKEVQVIKDLSNLDRFIKINI